MDKARQALEKYVNTATDLAESIKRNIVHGGAIDNETVLKLNAFIIASNEIADLTEAIFFDTNKTDSKLH